MNDQYKREVVVITGASAGVGRAAARRFAQSGAQIGLLARGRDGLERLRWTLRDWVARLWSCTRTYRARSTWRPRRRPWSRSLDPIDTWVNNAMVSVLSPFKQMTADEFRRVTEVTYLGYVHGTMSALKRMLPRDRGAIVQVGSALAYRGIPLQSAYSGAKHAIQGFTESVRAELLHDKSNVWLTMVQMPALNTPQFNWIKSRMPRKPRPVPPIFQPEGAAEAIYWAAHHRRRELYVGLSSLIVIWGNKLAPYLGDRYLAGSGYDSQQYDGAPEPDRPDNLWEPVVGDWGAHGDFDSQAKSTSAQSWADTHRGVIAVAGAGLAAGSVGLGGFLGALLRRDKPQRRAKR